MRARSLLALALLTSAALAAPASAGLEERVDSAGQLVRDGVQAFGALDASAAYAGVQRYEERETAYAWATYAFAAGWIEEQSSDLGPLGEFAGSRAAEIALLAGQAADDDQRAGRHAANSCGEGLFPAAASVWEAARGVCLDQRQAAEQVAGQPLPEL
ncbi:MAG TPA: hypothetical protein VGR28_05030 [Candidatus Thermoplasmatota archaeon]|jgi:hypothetical protein|nr:hypothetical protein [Candidatus Thermoplasmatota archaeon]